MGVLIGPGEGRALPAAAGERQRHPRPARLSAAHRGPARRPRGGAGDLPLQRRGRTTGRVAGRRWGSRPISRPACWWRRWWECASSDWGPRCCFAPRTCGRSGAFEALADLHRRRLPIGAPHHGAGTARRAVETGGGDLSDGAHAGAKSGGTRCAGRGRFVCRGAAGTSGCRWPMPASGRWWRLLAGAWWAALPLLALRIADRPHGGRRHSGQPGSTASLLPDPAAGPVGFRGVVPAGWPATRWSGAARASA